MHPRDDDLKDEVRAPSAILRISQYSNPYSARVPVTMQMLRSIRDLCEKISLMSCIVRNPSSSVAGSAPPCSAATFRSACKRKPGLNIVSHSCGSTGLSSRSPAF